MEKEKKKRNSTLIIDGIKYKTQIPAKYKNKKKYEVENPRLITAFIPGTILEIYVKEGDAVREGDSLVILDAMKMHNVLRAPFDGKIKKVYCEVGAMVPKSELLVEIE